VEQLAQNGGMASLLKAGARILEPSCGPCIGMGQAPKTDGISIRTFNRNFKGRCGTMTGQVYLVSPETAAASAICGSLISPDKLDKRIQVEARVKPKLNDSYLIYPKYRDSVVMGPNIKAFPLGVKLGASMAGKVILKVANNITTDDIVPSNAKLLPLRSNIPKLSEYCFSTILPDFKRRAESVANSIVVGGENYGQGSSREHAALVPLYLGVRAVVAKSFARIHRKNLINAGILPLQFLNPADYDRISEMDNIRLKIDFDGSIRLNVEGTRNELELVFNGSEREIEILRAGGFINYEKAK